MEAKHFFLALLLTGIASIGYTQDSIKKPEFTYKGFLDVNARLDISQSTIFIGGFDNYISAQINDKISLIGEVIIEPSNSRFRTDVDRLQLKYYVWKYLEILVGRFYAPIGYYNTTYFSDRAALMAPSIQRPSILTFEDDGGMLETKPSGICFSGKKITPLNINYDIAISNGTGSKPLTDNDKDKAITCRLSFSPTENLYIGGGTRFDKIDEDVVTLTTFSETTKKYVGENVNNEIYSAFVAFNNSKLLFINEFYWFNNRSDINGYSQSRGGFAILGYTFKERFMPYVKVDYIDIEDENKDLYYSPKAESSDISVGFRFDIMESTILKLELRRFTNEHSGVLDQAQLQFAVKF